jgi:hypothetical protein
VRSRYVGDIDWSFHAHKNKTVTMSFVVDRVLAHNTDIKALEAGKKEFGGMYAHVQTIVLVTSCVV